MRDLQDVCYFSFGLVYVLDVPLLDEVVGGFVDILEVAGDSLESFDNFLAFRVLIAVALRPFVDSCTSFDQNIMELLLPQCCPFLHHLHPLLQLRIFQSLLFKQALQLNHHFLVLLVLFFDGHELVSFGVGAVAMEGNLAAMRGRDGRIGVP